MLAQHFHIRQSDLPYIQRRQRPVEQMNEFERRGVQACVFILFQITGRRHSGKKSVRHVGIKIQRRHYLLN